MAVQKAERSSYRPEIQGLRTIGALLVAGFHIWGARVSGGVDVFFVVSGFLISGSLYREVQKTQTIDIIGFWIRIAKRIAPLAYTVLAFTLMAALLWAPLTEREEALGGILYSALHLENLKLMLSAVDYLARDDAPSLVQQFWALSVQMQFYAAWPLMLIAAAFTTRRLRLGDRFHPIFLAGILCASLAYSIVVTGSDPAPAYFNTFARVWEFSLGGILAIVLPNLHVPRKARLVMGWCGLLAIVSCGFVLPASVNFPGYAALWPVLGAAFVLIAGNSGTGLGVERLLAAKPLVRFGEFSFGFYLWHWPVLVFTLILTGQTELGLVGGLAVIAFAGCCAFLTHRWIEQPVQRLALDNWREWRHLALRAGVAASILVLAGGVIVAHGPLEGRTDDVIAAYRSMPLKPAIALAVKDIPRIYPDQCNQSQDGSELIACTYGNTINPAKTVALVGSSHSAHWFPALETLAEQNRWRLVIMTKHGCPLSAESFGHASCEEWNDAAIEHLVSVKPDMVFTTATRPGAGTQGEGHVEHVPEGYLKQWARLEEAGVTLIALRDTPWIKIKVPACLEGAPSKGVNCGRPRRDIMDEVDPSSMLEARPENVAFIDLTDQFCDRQICPPIRNNMIIYRDGSHLTATYAESLAPVLGKRIRHVRPDLFPVEAKSALTKAERS